MKKVLTSILIIILLCLSVSLDVGAVSYTYDSEGRSVLSPDAYSVEKEITGDSINLGKLSAPSDIKITEKGVVAISDTANKRVIITDISFKDALVISEFSNNGIADSLDTPEGVCFDNNGHLYVCDKTKHRILEFDSDYSYIRSIENLQQSLLPDGFTFAPSAVCVDKWGTIYCISDSSTNGYLQFSKNGVFKGFMGSPKTTLSFVQKFWRSVQTKEQRKRTVNETPINFNNLVVDEEGFVYTTEINPNKESTAIEIQSGTKSGLFMPIKKFNFNGSDVLLRQDFYAPSGDISFEKSIPENEKDSDVLWSSTLVSITLGKDGCYFVADSKRGKIFGYDANGNLLYAFAGTGAQTGLFSDLCSIAYHDEKIYALDKNQGVITCFTITEYGKILHEAARLTTERKFDEAVEKWESVLNHNGNLTIAYMGLGRTYLDSGDYVKAMNCFKTALSVDDYSEAFSKYREKLLGDWFLVIPLAIVALIFLIAFAFSKIKKFNLSSSPLRYKFSGHMFYSAYVIFRPFDGFWDIKHEKRGSVRVAILLLSLTAIFVSLQYRFMGFSFTGGRTTNPLIVIVIIIGAAFVFCLSNWCLTSLTNGKGNMKDIITVVGYSSLPLLLTSVPIMVLSNILTANESGFVTLFIYIAYIWTAFLLFVGIMTVHEYTFGQNILSVLFTIIGMLVIIFISFLLINLFGKISGFISELQNEIGLRV